MSPAPAVHATLLDVEIWQLTDAFVLLVDAAGEVLGANPAAEFAFGDGQLVRADVRSAVVARETPDFLAAVRRAAGQGVSCTHEYEVPFGPEHERCFVAWSITRVSIQPALVVCVGVDVTTTRNEFDTVRARSVTDELTGLANRAGLLDQLAQMAGSGASVVFCDLNGFKAINDRYGHGVGDQVLVQIARRLQRTVRGEDFLARLGGDEFVIVVPPDADADFEALARRVLRATDQPLILPGPVVATVGISIGMAVLDKGEDPSAVLTLADKNMYLMKSRRTTQATPMVAADNPVLR